MKGKTHEVDLITFGNLMNLVDMKNRWMYAGGLTTPPCTTKVLFNICRTVYPIKQRHVDAFRALFALDDTNGLKDT